jgi:hypothetical protein
MSEVSAEPDSKSGFGTKPETIIWAVGDIGGGTCYFSESNMVGLYRKLKEDIKNGLVPDHLIFNGELLPKVPRWITRGGMSDSLALADNIEDLNDAAVYMKAHMSRIVNLVSNNGHRCGITYVMGESDRENIKNKYDLLIYCYKSRPKDLAGFLFNMREKIESEVEILGNQIKQLRVETDDSKKKYWRSKIRVQNSYVRDYKDIERGYAELVQNWVENNNEMDPEELLEKFGDYAKNPAFVKILLDGMEQERQTETLIYLERRYKSASKKLADIKRTMGKDKKQIKKAEEELKEFRLLQNKIKKMGYQKIVNFEKKIAKESSEGAMEAAIMHFANTIPGNSKQAKLSYRIAKREIKTKIKDAFGRQMHIELQENNEQIEEINGIKVMTMHKPVTDSVVVAKKIQGLAQKVHGEEGRVDLLISAHSAKASEEIIPARNFSNEYTYSVTLPFFVDAGKLRQARNEEIKTPLTKAAGTMLPSSGAYKIVHNGYSFETTFYSSEYLKVLSDIEKDEQIAKFADNLRQVKLTRKKLELDKTDLLQIGSRLYGDEIRDAEILNKLLVSHGISPANKKVMRELISSIENRNVNSTVQEVRALLKGRFLSNPAKSELQEINFAIISDAHIGSNGLGMSTLDLIRALQKPIIESFRGRPFIFLGLGDNIEANIKNYKDRTDLENDAANEERFYDYLVKDCKMSPDSPKFRSLMNEYKADLFDKSIAPHNYDVQAQKWAWSVLPIVNAAELSVLVSGNHPNQTPLDQSLDESIKLKEQLIAKGAVAGIGIKEERIKTVPGGNFGLGEFGLYDGSRNISSQTSLKVGSDTLTFYDTTMGGQPFWLAHRLPRDVHKAVAELGLVGPKLGGHVHNFRKDIVNNSFQLSVPALRGLLTFPNEAGFCVTDSTRGAVVLRLHYAQGNPEPVVSSTRVIMLKELRERGIIQEENPRIAEFKLMRRSSPKEKVMVATSRV